MGTDEQNDTFYKLVTCKLTEMGNHFSLFIWPQSWKKNARNVLLYLIPFWAVNISTFTSIWKLLPFSFEREAFALKALKCRRVWRKNKATDCQNLQQHFRWKWENIFHFNSAALVTHAWGNIYWDKKQLHQTAFLFILCFIIQLS